MTETSLLAFQMEEVLSSIKVIVCGFFIIVGVGLWIHATYFREGD